jgi:hypothetical protein
LWTLIEPLREDYFSAHRGCFSIAEVGCAEGLFSEDMLKWERSGRMYLVDNWGTLDDQTGDGAYPNDWHEKNLRDCMERMRPYADRVRFLRGRSDEMATYVRDASLSLVYLDACHSKDGVLKDLRAWLPKLAPGGIMAGHDYLNPGYGVQEAVAEFAAGRFDVHLIPEHKAEDAGFWFRV